MLRKASGVDSVVNGDDPSAQAQTLVSDRFDATIRPGRVVGSRSPDGRPRRGVDHESIISADNGALRIAPPLEPGWGREGISYGPFRREAGIAFAVFMVNGHNTSQSENLPETFSARLDRWLVGPEVFRRRQRLLQWLKSTRKLRTLRHWRWWRRISNEAPPVPRINENLAVGWFADETPRDPLHSGNALVMHATGPENGELWARCGEAALAAVRGVQNLQVYYVVVLRETGAAYYASSVPDAHGLGCYPELRPLAIDPFGTDQELYAGLHQSTLGQIGFRLDTRVYGTRIARVGAWSQWYGSAMSADRLHGSGALRGSQADIGGAWEVASGDFERTASGARPTADGSVALLGCRAPAGLVHALVRTGNAFAAVALLWRHVNDANHWRLSLDSRGAALVRVNGGVREEVARSDAVRLIAGRAHSVQVLDDGNHIGVHLDGTLLFGRRFEDRTLAPAARVGFATSGSDTNLLVERFEAHPRSCALPGCLDMGRPWYRLGERLLARDDFEGPERDLHGKPTGCGTGVWQRSIGSGTFRVTGEGSARIVATAQQPCPGRTAYTLDWMQPGFADLEVEITPAGTAKGQGEHGLCGFILWQDPDNYVTLNIWRYDSYDGASISTFFQIDGFEDLYDAIWANVGNRVFWGKPCRLRMVFDGMHYMAFVNDQPVMYRALTDVYPDAKRLEINRVGLLANWEWGTDTGSRFRHFKARG